MEGIEEGTGNEILGPNHARGPDEEASADPREAETRELGSEHQDECEPVSELET